MTTLRIHLVLLLHFPRGPRYRHLELVATSSEKEFKEMEREESNAGETCPDRMEPRGISDLKQRSLSRKKKGVDVGKGIHYWHTFINNDIIAKPRGPKSCAVKYYKYCNYCVRPIYARSRRGSPAGVQNFRSAGWMSSRASRRRGFFSFSRASITYILPALRSVVKE